MSKKAKPQPHIVLIVTDDLGYNDVPWHNPTIISPHLQDLAKAGVILEQNYVQTKCSPSRAALMTDTAMHTLNTDIILLSFQVATLSTLGTITRASPHRCRQV